MIAVLTIIQQLNKNHASNCRQQNLNKSNAGIKYIIWADQCSPLKFSAFVNQHLTRPLLI